MDFLDIRKKAKERADDEAAEDPSRPACERPGPALAELDVIEGALAARLQGLPPPAPLDPARDAAGVFTTWRPGAEPPPPIPPERDAPSLGFAAREADFVVVGPDALLAAARARERDPPDAPPPGDPLDDFFYRPDEAAPALPQLGPAAQRVPDEPAPRAREEYLTFHLGSEEYAVAIESVREVIREPPVTEVPRAPAHILGVVTVRGDVVTVIEPRRRLGLPADGPTDGQGKIVVVDTGEGPCGLLVDRVASVVRLRPGSLEPCPPGIAGQRSELLAGIGREGARLFTVLDLGALIRRGPPRADRPGARRAGAGA